MHPCGSCALEYFFTGNGNEEASWLDKLNFCSKRYNNNFNKLSRGFFRIIYNVFLKMYIIVILRKNTNLIYNLM